VISNTIIRGAADIFCFLVVMVVILMGYVAMGHTVFGTIMVDFSTVQYSLITCFQMFLGTFRNFEVMRQANSIAYFFYWYTYMVLFRYVLVNMFFAIIAKHFQVEDKETEEKFRQ
ncbi:pkd2, partial [Symbiodinium pilosum]